MAAVGPTMSACPLGALAVLARLESWAVFRGVHWVTTRMRMIRKAEPVLSGDRQLQRVGTPSPDRAIVVPPQRPHPDLTGQQPAGLVPTYASNLLLLTQPSSPRHGRSDTLTTIPKQTSARH